MPAPSRLLIVIEPEQACRDRLRRLGFAAAVADEVAPYLAQATDLAAYTDEIAAALAAIGCGLEVVDLDTLAGRPIPAGAMLWGLTDGIAYFRGSAVAAFARLAGVPAYGSPPQAQHLAQDKFKCLALAAAAGLPVPPALLLRGDAVVARHGHLDPAALLFVKPNRLGAKIGIFGDSLCIGLDEARDRSRRLAERYGDEAVVQAFVPGSDVRVSWMDLGQPLGPSLGIGRLGKDPASETGGAYLTMRDNASLSGSRDTEGGTTPFGQGQARAFVPKLDDLRRDPAAAAAVVEIEQMVGRAVRLFGLKDYFSFDFRLGDDGRPWFLEFEVCPAVTIFDFQTYLRTTYGLGLGPALARSVARAIDLAGTSPQP